MNDRIAPHHLVNPAESLNLAWWFTLLGVRAPMVQKICKISQRHSNDLWRQTHGRASPSGLLPSFDPWLFESFDRRLNGYFLFIFFQIHQRSHSPEHAMLLSLLVYFSQVSDDFRFALRHGAHPLLSSIVEADQGDVMSINRAISLLDRFHAQSKRQGPAMEGDIVPIKCRRCPQIYLGRLGYGELVCCNSRRSSSI
jgi:hypothetical protein